MNHKLTLTVLLSLSAASGQALALGLGEAKVRSPLGAPLRASIPLTATAGLEPGLLNVSLADPGAFAAAGLSHPPLLGSLDMAVRERGDRLVLELRSARAVSDPWLDLLLHFDWPGGRQQREVTLLFDPPDYATLPNLAGGEATVSASTRQQVSSPDAARVRTGDTLWSLAERLRPAADVSVEQMMLALLQANPQAFPSGNINGLLAGASLTVPPRDAVTVRSPERASELVDAMNRAWTRRDRGASVRVPLDDAATTTAGTSTEPEATAAPAGSVTEADAAGEATLADGEASTPRLTLLTEQEAAGLAVSEDAAAPAPVAAGEASPQVQFDPALLMATLGLQDRPGESARLRQLEQRWEESREALAAMRAERDALAGRLDSLRGELDALRDRVAALSRGAASTDQAADTLVSGWKEGLSRPLILGGVGLAALMTLWALVRRRRRREETPATAFGEVRVVAPQGARSAPVAEAAVGDAEELEEQAASTAASARMPEAESISEADIFIAYGRFDQARELLETRLEQAPERDDLRLKLLGVMLAQGERAAAEAEAARLRARGDPALEAEVARLLEPRSTVPTEASTTDDAAGEGAPKTAEPEPSTLPEAADVTTAPPSSPEPDIIDYRPPSLEPAQAPRQESPMQPSVEFTPLGAETAAPAGNDDEADWDIEEVAFPRRDEDNASDAAAKAPFTALLEAQRLLEVGESDRARLLLEELVEAAVDPEARQQARELLERQQT